MQNSRRSPRIPLLAFLAAILTMSNPASAQPQLQPQQLPAPVAPVAPTADDVLQASTWPARVQQKVTALQAKGVQLQHVRRVAYTPVQHARKPDPLPFTASAAKPNPSAVIQDFPSGCGLWVIVYRSGSIIHNSSVTSCLHPVGEIEMLGGLARSRWWGWEEMAQDEDGNVGSDYLDLEVTYNCAGTGTHDYQGVTNGYLEIAGRGYHAAAWDQIDRIECG